MELVIADKDGRAVLQTAECELDMAYGADENDFSLTMPANLAPPRGGMVYIDGSAWGGWVDEITTDVDPRFVTCRGRAAHGVLAAKRLVPDAGRARFGVSGDVSSALRSVLERVGLLGAFEVAEGIGGSVTHEFERFCDAWSGIRAMLRSCSMRPALSCVEGRVIVGAEPVRAVTADSDAVGFEVTEVARCVNHLVCGGTGEGEGRVVLHFYADAAGNVGETQSLFGVDEITAFYDYTNADETKLREDGRKKLEEMQTRGAVEITPPEDLDAEVGDVLVARDNASGVEVRAEIVKKILKLQGGVPSVTYEVGKPAAAASTITGTAETSGAVSYVAGDGITIAGGKISADVTQPKLDAVSATAESARKAASDAQAAAGRAQQTADGKADAGHKHSASDVTSGVLPVARGGTGATSRVGVWNNVMMMELLDWETVDWNTLTDSGFARNTSLSGKNAPPCGYPYGMLEVARSNINPLAQYLIQRWTSDGMHGSYVRNGWKESDGSYSWSSWNKLAYEQDVAPKSHKHSKADVTDFPSSMPASDVSAWAKAPTKPTYTAAEVGAAPKSHRHAWGEVTGKPTTYPPEAHTHPYAGSQSAGGAATSAVKLATARKITLAGAVNGSAAFDGSADVTITVEGDSAAAGFLAAHPVGFYVTCKAGVDPNSVGGTWEQAPSMGPCVWLRTK